GGFINPETEEGKGTTFWVYLPVTEAETGASALKAVARSARGKGERILAADDDPLVLDVVEEFLKSSGYDVITVQDGQEAVEKFRQERDRIDLVLLDVVMPRISGREAFRQIRKLRPDVKVLFASGNHVDIPEAVEESGAAFIQKPYSLSELLRSIRQILDRS
ncbi:MAG: response regulator, partial [bacterium]